MRRGDLAFIAGVVWLGLGLAAGRLALMLISIIAFAAACVWREEGE